MEWALQLILSTWREKNQKKTIFRGQIFWESSPASAVGWRVRYSKNYSFFCLKLFVAQNENSSKVYLVDKTK